MGLMDNIQKDVQRITTEARGFSVPVLFSVTDGVTVTSVTCNAIAVKHNISIDETTGDIRTGIVSNSRTVRVTVSELALKAKNYPVRNTNNHVDLIGNQVTWTDVSGVQATYVVKEQYPDETTGCIVLFLGTYGAVTPPGRIIIGWMQAVIAVEIKTTPNTANVQTLPNGDTIPVEYALNNDGTLTIPYMVGRVKLEPFMMDNMPIQNMPFDSATGKFDASIYGGFIPDVNIISINASIPIWRPS